MQLWTSTALAKPETFEYQRQGSLRLLSEANYFTTEANYASDGGTFTELQNGRNFKNLQIDVGGQYAFSKRLYLGSALSIANSESYDGSFTRSNSGLTEVKFWAQYIVMVRPLRIIPEVQFWYPFNRVESNTDETLTGEGAMVLQPGSWFIKPFKAFDVFSYLGIKYQDEGRATLLPYRLGLEYNFSRFFVGAGLNGYQTLIDDEDTATPSNKTSITNRVNGMSLKFYSINPSLLEADAWLGMKFSKTSQLRLGLSQTLNGENSAEGLTVHAAIYFELMSPKSVRKRTAPSEDGFEIQQDKYDESLFQQEQRRRRQQQQRPPAPQGPSEEQLLEETMESLENFN